jgi:hypothetical protein
LHTSFAFTRIRTLGLGAALALAVFVTYHASLRVPLDSDARFLTYANAYTLAPDGLARIWTADFFQGAITHGVTYASGYYRPVTNAVFWFEYRLAGRRPWPYHATQLLLHALNGFLLFLLVRRLTGRWWAGAFAAFVFVVHPVNAFAASQPAARGDVLFVVFYLLALLVFDGALVAPAGTRVRWRLALTVLLFLCSVLSKEMGITLPAALGLLVLYRHFERGADWRGLLWTAPAWAAGGAYLVWRFAILRLPVSMPTVGYAAEYPPYVLFLAALKGPLIHLSRLVVPLGATYPELDPSLVNYAARTWADPLALVAAAVAVVLVLLAFRWRRDRDLAFWSGLFLVTYAPLARVDNIAGTLSLNVFLTQERWIYLPGMAAIGAFAVGAARLADRLSVPSRRPLLAAAASAVILLLGSAASQHAGRHADPFAELRRLYLQPEDRLSRFERANKLLLYADWVAMPRGDSADAEARARSAVQSVPDSPIPAVALAGILGRRGEWTEVRPLLEPWFDPPLSRLLAIRGTNPRVGDDMNRVSVVIPYLLARADAHAGNGPLAAALLCESVRRDLDQGRIAVAARELYALDGPPRCLAAAGPAACAARVELPAGSPFRPPFDSASCRNWPAALAR